AMLAASLFVTAALLLTLAVGSTIVAVQLRSSSLAAQRNEALAARGRDQLQESLRRLVFDVNEILDADEVDLDEAQESLLMVAIEGMRKVAEMGDATLDESSAASKNRLAQVLFRLDRDDQARAYFGEALSETETLLERGQRSDAVWLEKLHALRGLQMIADYESRDGDVQNLQMRITTEVPPSIIALAATLTLNADAWIDDATERFHVEGTQAGFESLGSGLGTWEPELNSDDGPDSLNEVLALCISLSDDAVATEQFGLANDVWDQFERFVIRQQKRRDSDERAANRLVLLRFDCQLERSWVAYARGEQARFIELFQSAIDWIELQEASDRDEFRWRREYIHDEVASLMETIIEESPDLIREHSEWFVQLARQDRNELQQLAQADQETPDFWVLDIFTSQVHSAQILEIVGRRAEAVEMAQTTRKELDAFDLTGFAKPDRRSFKSLRQAVEEIIAAE
ncbi:MAG: hypothetical protein AAFX06_12900, partial [Planctomycetota bacterium]